MVSNESMKQIMDMLLAPTSELSPSILISATYDGKVAVLKLYNPDDQRIHLLYDTTGHRPYCLSKLSISQLSEIGDRKDVVELKASEKVDLLNDQKIAMTKIVATNPIAIGGSDGSIRNIIETWESDIKYYENYLYDYGLIVGAFYEVKNSRLIPVFHEMLPAVRESLEKSLQNLHPSIRDHTEEWARLLSQPLPALRRVALDIEVLPAEENRIPNPNEASNLVVAASLVGSDDVHEVFLLRRDVEEGIPALEKGVSVRFFSSERALLEAIFRRISQYPIVVTYNGDDFDLKYLYNRSLKQSIGLGKEDIPISLGKDVAYVKHGIHIDLYRTFINRSLQIYAFGNKYAERTLN
ncbi:MAG: 3'-5' exonuclease, partial [Candidatus Thorarchaeota archaeon]